MAAVGGIAASSTRASVLTLHSGMASSYLGAAGAWQRMLARFACWRFTRVVCVSPEIRRAVSSLGVPAGPTRYTLALNSSALSIETLRARPFGGSPIKITRVVSTDTTFQRVLFEYTSDGLRITGMMNIPQGIGPFPVIILDHGYFKPSEYKTGDGTIKAADNFARHGYLTLSPDYRCYGGSQCASNPLDVGYAIDVLNLIASLPSLGNADTSRIGIWGHSMGGGVTMKVLTMDTPIRAAVLYSTVSADDTDILNRWGLGCIGDIEAGENQLGCNSSDVVPLDLPQELIQAYYEASLDPELMALTWSLGPAIALPTFPAVADLVGGVALRGGVRGVLPRLDMGAIPPESTELTAMQAFLLSLLFAVCLSLAAWLQTWFLHWQGSNCGE